MPSKILFAVTSFAAVAYLILIVLSVREGEGAYAVASNAVVAMIFGGLSVANWLHLRRHRKSSARLTE
jgi:hypothetical protein